MEQVIERILGMDITIRPNESPTMNSFEFKGIVGLPIQVGKVLTQIEIQEV